MYMHRNGIRVAPPPALPREGSYVRQLVRKIPYRTKLPWYVASPIDGWGLAPIHPGLDRGTVFGPVHETLDARATHGLISVCVPPPLCCLPHFEREYLPRLIWINICTCRHPTPSAQGYHRYHHFCETVEAREVEQWRANGWYDIRIQEYWRADGL